MAARVRMDPVLLHHRLALTHAREQLGYECDAGLLGDVPIGLQEALDIGPTVIRR
jgi:hypothetical protein